MATVVFSAIGAAAGSSVGGTFLGLSMTAVGRFAGAMLGQRIDNRINGQGSEPVEVGRLDRLRVTNSGEGQSVPLAFGRVRVGGQVIWASRFSEHVNVSKGASGQKGVPDQPDVRTYSYSVSLAIALCEGKITHVPRIWADGEELSPQDLHMRVHYGDEDQLPDLKIQAVEGYGKAPAYRGIAYVVFEDLNLTRFGNRIPQFSFEICRPAQVETASGPEVPDVIKAVALIPGSGEYVLSTQQVNYRHSDTEWSAANVNTPLQVPNFLASVDMMEKELPSCKATSLIVSWFGDDLRCGYCKIRPKVEQNNIDSEEMPWTVSGVTRKIALSVLKEKGRPIYGGTPSDQSVIEAIKALRLSGQDVMFYPFILMDQATGNALPDPYSDSKSQPPLPWRGRITLSKAPGQANSPDCTQAADSEVRAFFGSAKASHFALWDDEVHYSGPEDWGLRRFVLHNAYLCMAAGGVSAFCIGSELRGLTQIRGASNRFVAVEELRDLANEVRAILGPKTKIGYAADWSEYFGYHPQDGSGDVYFNLDSLWADRNIDFVGIDNYMPLSDWREDEGHADKSWGSIYNLDYLQANIEGGEGYDWYYPSQAARDAQMRTPITDEYYDEAWIWRYKDIKNWWKNPHYNRIGGIRQAAHTDWRPQSKPIWFTELGCAAIDKGTNQPNKFLDPKSSESGLPHYSNAQRDEHIQMQYLRAMHHYWSDPAHNPISYQYGDHMIDLSRGFVWAWDARPYPWFPNGKDLWSDGKNYARGHWLNGRVSSVSLAALVAEICEASGVTDYDVSALHGFVRGYHTQHITTARSVLQPLALQYGFDAVEKDGKITFLHRKNAQMFEIKNEDLVINDGLDGHVVRTRESEPELFGRIQMSYIEADADYGTTSEEVALPTDETHAVSRNEVPLVLTRQEARQALERWLNESRVARDTIRFGVPLSYRKLSAGDMVTFSDDMTHAAYRVDRSEMGTFQIIEATRTERSLARAPSYEAETIVIQSGRAALPVYGNFMNLPLLNERTNPYAPFLAVNADPLASRVAVYGSDSTETYHLDHILAQSAQIGRILNPLPASRAGLLDYGHELQVSLKNAELSSISLQALLSGGNLCALGSADKKTWEILQFKNVQLMAENTYRLSGLLRGQLGSDADIPSLWPEGTQFVVINDALTQPKATADDLGRLRQFRIGPADRPEGDSTFTKHEVNFTGQGLRPYSPCHLRSKMSPQGMEFCWIRRTRLGGDVWRETDVPLNEALEKYRVRVLRSDKVLREEIVYTPTYIYPTSQQDEDGIKLGEETFLFEVAQISEVFGAGPAKWIEF